MKVVIFARVSRKDQSYQRQVNELLEYAIAQGWEVLEEVTEKVSGTTTSYLDRPGVQRLFEVIRKEKVNKVLVSEVSRLGRRTQDVLLILDELHKRGISLYVHQYHLQTLDSNGKPNSMAQFLITLLGDIARMETATLTERINSGLDEARRKGKKLGRPQGTTKGEAALLDEYKQVVKELKQGLPQRKAAKVAGVSLSTVQRVAKALKAT